MITFVCPECGENPDSDGSRYVVDGVDVCSINCWFVRLGGHKAIITAEYIRRVDDMPRYCYGGNA